MTTHSIAPPAKLMNNLVSSVPVQRIAKSLLIVFAASAACTFFAACAGPAYRHDARADNRVDRRMDRRHDRWD